MKGTAVRTGVVALAGVLTGWVCPAPAQDSLSNVEEAATDSLLKDVSAEMAGTESDEEPAESEFGPFAYFDGSNVVGLMPNAAFDLTQGTIEFWMSPGVNPFVVDYYPCVLSLGWGMDVVRYAVRLAPTLGAIGLENSEVWDDVSFLFEPGEWYHVAMATDDESTDVYVNGEWIGVLVASYGTVGGAPLRIGMSGEETDGFIGGLTGVRLWNRVLTEEEVGELASSRGPGVTSALAPHLVAFSELEEGELVMRVESNVEEGEAQ